MIKTDDLSILNGKTVYDTSNDEYVVYEDSTQIINEDDYKLLGFHHDCRYSASSNYLVKNTLDGREIARIYLDIDSGVFREDSDSIYFYKDKTLYKIDSYFEIEWELEFDDEIRSAFIDLNDCVYVLFKHSRMIRKFAPDSSPIVIFNDSDDPTRTCRLYCGFVNDGGGHLYVLGNEFYDDKCHTFVDHYDNRKCELIERIDLGTKSNVAVDDTVYEYQDFKVDGDYIYLHSSRFISKYNIAGKQMWVINMTYDTTRGDEFSSLKITFDDKKFKDRIYFCEDYTGDNTGFRIGKISLNGDIIWELNSIYDTTNDNYSMCIYKGKLYLSNKLNVLSTKSYILALDNNNVLFETRDGSLIRVVQFNYEEIYDHENYIGYHLLGRERKADIDKFIAETLLSNYGNILGNNGDEDFEILLDIENENYNDDENFDYFNLIGREDIQEANTYTRINTFNSAKLMTKHGSYINTLYPYQPDFTNQFIVSPDGTLLDTNDDKHLVRGKDFYTDYFFLLSDEHKFGQDIITKAEEKVILTKKHNFSIRRKKRLVWRYVVRTLCDLDILVQHLQENGILESLVPKYVEKLKHHTYNMIKDMQGAICPVYYNIEGDKKYSYHYNGHDYPLRMPHIQIFLCKNIPFTKKDGTDNIYIDSLANLVQNDKVKPFVLFLDGVAIKWSNISIIKDWHFSYIMINNCDIESKKIECILFPDHVRYGEDKNIMTTYSGMYFDKNGLFTTDKNKTAMRIEILDKSILVDDTEVDKKFVNSGTKNIIGSKVFNFNNIADNNQITNPNNIIVFEDGKLFGDSRLYLEHKGDNIYLYNHNISSKTKVYAKLFYFNQANDTKTMVNNIPNQKYTKEVITSGINSNKGSSVDYFLEPFDFKFSRDKSYLVNISEATKYILTYKTSLLADYYRDQSNIKSYTFTGEKIISLSERNGGLLYMPRQMSRGMYDFVLMFVNDNLYEYYREIKYLNKEFVIPIFTHIKKTDKVEIVHFKHANNSFSNMIINPNDLDYIEEDLRYNDFLLFGNSESGSETYPEFNRENYDQYLIDFEYRNLNNDYDKYIGTELKLDDYYINKNINIASKRQFQYTYYIVQSNEIKTYKLTPSFRFCKFKNQFMIFLNDKKLNFNEWNLNDNNHSIEILPTLTKGDVVNIFYIPDSYEEIIFDKFNSGFKDIIIDTSELGYGFDNELFMIFVDGHKIATDNIQNISMDRIRIKSDYSINSSICICKFMNPDKLLEKLVSYSDKWSDAIADLSEKDYENLFIKASN